MRSWKSAQGFEKALMLILKSFKVNTCNFSAVSFHSFASPNCVVLCFCKRCVRDSEPANACVYCVCVCVELSSKAVYLENRVFSAVLR